MRSQIVLLSLLVGIATVVQPTALAESADACTQVGDKACELAEDAIAGDAEAMADLESFDRVKEILDREALAALLSATPKNRPAISRRHTRAKAMLTLSSADLRLICTFHIKASFCKISVVIQLNVYKYSDF